MRFHSMNRDSAGESNSRLLTLGCVAVIAVAVLAIYTQVASHQFVRFDDGLYVTDNYYVLQGLTFESVLWALRSVDIANWHPLTLISHMIDVEVWGLRAGGHALSSMVLHGIASVLMFRVFWRLGNNRAAALFVALVFAVHPANVESVAWIAQRKSVLSAVFWCVTVLAYLRYVEAPSFRRYALVAFAFILGLMSKPVVVTLPFVLLVLDWWPLGRFGRIAPLPHFSAVPEAPLGGMPAAARLILEKVPLLVLSATVGLVTYSAQDDAGAMAPGGLAALDSRGVTAVVSTFDYLKMYFLPGKLAVFYPLTNDSVAWGWAACVVLAISVVCLAVWRRRPAAICGWLLFLGMLLPMSGVVQVGSQRMADRYLYLPMVGLSWCIAHLVTELPERHRALRWALVLIGLPWLGWLGVRAHAQVGTWVDSVALAEQTAVGDQIPRIMANNLAIAQTGPRGESEAEAILRGMPSSDSVASYNLGLLYLQQQRYVEAVPLLAARAGLADADPHSHFQLARALAALDRMEEAQDQIDRCRAKLPRSTHWRKSVEALRRVVSAPDFTVAMLAVPSIPEGAGGAPEFGSAHSSNEPVGSPTSASAP